MITLKSSNNQIILTNKNIYGELQKRLYKPKFKNLKHNSSKEEIRIIVEKEYQKLSNQYNLSGSHGSVEIYQTLVKHCYDLKNKLTIDNILMN